MRSTNPQSIRAEACNSIIRERSGGGRIRRAAARHNSRTGRRLLLGRRGCWWRVDQELNYFNYFTEIERFYQSKRESFTLLSALDWVLIENWKEQGVPLDLVLKGIERAFSTPSRRRKINSLAYCVKAVEMVHDEQKDLSVESPKMPDFGKDELSAYIMKLANEIAPLDEGVAASVRAVNLNDLRMA